MAERTLPGVQDRFLGEEALPEGVTADRLSPGAHASLVNLRPRGRELAYLETVDGVAQAYAAPETGPGRAIAKVEDPSGRVVTVVVVGPRVWRLEPADPVTDPTPDLIPDLRGWYDSGDFDDGNDHDLLRRWRDRSGRNQDLTPPCSAPELRARILNDRPVVRFTGAQGITRPYLDDEDWDWSDPFTVGLVVVPRALPAAGQLATLVNAQGITGDEAGWKVSLKDDGTVQVLVQQDAARYMAVTTEHALTVDEPAVVLVRAQALPVPIPVGPPGLGDLPGRFSVHISRNDRENLTTTHDNVGGSTRPRRPIGWGSNQCARQYLTGDLGGMVVLNREIDDDETDWLLRYWSDRFAIALGG